MTEFEQYWDKHGVKMEPKILKAAFKEIAQKAWEASSLSSNEFVLEEMNGSTAFPRYEGRLIINNQLILVAKTHHNSFYVCGENGEREVFTVKSSRWVSTDQCVTRNWSSNDFQKVFKAVNQAKFLLSQTEFH